MNLRNSATQFSQRRIFPAKEKCRPDVMNHTYRHRFSGVSLRSSAPEAAASWRSLFSFTPSALFFFLKTTGYLWVDALLGSWSVSPESFAMKKKKPPRGKTTRWSQGDRPLPRWSGLQWSTFFVNGHERIFVSLSGSLFFNCVKMTHL